MDLREANIDPGKLLDFHDVMLSRAQDDERARKAWEETDTADRRRRREELRRAWVGFHRHMQELHASLSEAHRTKAESLLALEGAHEGGGG